MPATRKDFVNQNEFMEEVDDYAHEDKLSPINVISGSLICLKSILRKQKHFSLPEA